MPTWLLAQNGSTLGQCQGDSSAALEDQLSHICFTKIKLLGPRRAVAEHLIPAPTNCSRHPLSKVDANSNPSDQPGATVLGSACQPNLHRPRGQRDWHLVSSLQVACSVQGAVDCGQLQKLKDTLSLLQGLKAKGNQDRLPRSCSPQMEKYLSVKGEIFMTMLSSEPMSSRRGQQGW